MWNTEEDAEVAEILAGGASHEGVAKLVEEGKGITTLGEVRRVEADGLGAGESCSICNRSGGGRVAVDAVGAGAEHGDAMAGDSFDARENERGVATSDSLPHDNAADFAIGDERNSPAGI